MNTINNWVKFHPLKRLGMTIKIPQSWKAFDQEGNLYQLNSIEKDLYSMVDELIKVQKK